MRNSPVVAQVGQRVLVAAGALQLARVGQQQPGRAELVERDVGQRDVLLHLGRARRPLAEPLGGDQRVVAEPQHVRRPRRSQVLRSFRHVVEGGVPVDLVGGRVEEGVLLVRAATR